MIVTGFWEDHDHHYNQMEPCRYRSDHLHDIIFTHCCCAFFPLVLWGWLPLIVVEDLFVYSVLVVISSLGSILSVSSSSLPLTLIHTKFIQGYAWWNQTWTCVSEKQRAFTPHRTLNFYAEKPENNKHTKALSRWQMDLLNQFKKTDCFYCEPLLCFYRLLKLPDSPIVVLCLLSTLEPYQCILSW